MNPTKRTCFPNGDRIEGGRAVDTRGEDARALVDRGTRTGRITVANDKQDITLEIVPADKAYRLLNHAPVVLVSTTDGITPNVSTVAWCAPCSMEPPEVMLCIDSGHRTARNIAGTGMLAINIPTADQVDLVMYCGSVSGNKVNKFQERDIPLRKSAHRGPPLVASCAAWLECIVEPCPDALKRDIVIARCHSAHCRPGVMSSAYMWNMKSYPVLHHLGGRRFLAGGEVITAAAGR